MRTLAEFIIDGENSIKLIQDRNRYVVTTGYLVQRFDDLDAAYRTFNIDCQIMWSEYREQF